MRGVSGLLGVRCGHVVRTADVQGAIRTVFRVHARYADTAQRASASGRAFVDVVPAAGSAYLPSADDGWNAGRYGDAADPVSPELGPVDAAASADAPGEPGYGHADGHAANA